MKKTLLYLILALTPALSKAQLGGKSVFHLFQYSNSARIAAMGGGLFAMSDSDPSLILYNPSIINKTHHLDFSLNFTDYFAHTLHTYAMYSHTFNKAGSFALGLQCAGYGKLERIDENGIEQGHFYAGDYLITLGWGRELYQYFSIGANFKMGYSQLESYSAFGLAADVAGTFSYPDKNMFLSVLVKNMGSELKTYTAKNFNSIPFEIQLAFSQRIKYIPVRYNIGLQHLQKWNLASYDPNDPFVNKDAITGEIKQKSGFNRFTNNFFRHIIFALEIQPVKYLYLNLGFNYNVNQEMKIIQKKTLAGFSYGFMIDIQNIKFGFSRAHYMRGAVPNYFTFSANIGDLVRLNEQIKSKKLQTVKQEVSLKP